MLLSWRFDIIPFSFPSCTINALLILSLNVTVDLWRTIFYHPPQSAQWSWWVCSYHSDVIVDIVNDWNAIAIIISGNFFFHSLRQNCQSTHTIPPEQKPPLMAFCWCRNTVGSSMLKVKLTWGLSPSHAGLTRNYMGRALLHFAYVIDLASQNNEVILVDTFARNAYSLSTLLKFLL